MDAARLVAGLDGDVQRVVRRLAHAARPRRERGPRARELGLEPAHAVALAASPSAASAAAARIASSAMSQLVVRVRRPRRPASPPGRRSARGRPRRPAGRPPRAGRSRRSRARRGAGGRRSRRASPTPRRAPSRARTGTWSWASTWTWAGRVGRRVCWASLAARARSRAGWSPGRDGDAGSSCRGRRTRPSSGAPRRGARSRRRGAGPSRGPAAPQSLISSSASLGRSSNAMRCQLADDPVLGDRREVGLAQQRARCRGRASVPAARRSGRRAGHGWGRRRTSRRGGRAAPRRAGPRDPPWGSISSAFAGERALPSR